MLRGAGISPDILDALPAETRETMLYAGPADSLPVNNPVMIRTLEENCSGATNRIIKVLETEQKATLAQRESEQKHRHDIERRREDREDRRLELEVQRENRADKQIDLAHRQVAWVHWAEFGRWALAGLWAITGIACGTYLLAQGKAELAAVPFTAGVGLSGGWVALRRFVPKREKQRALPNEAATDERDGRPRSDPS